jgi:hormone-sensitive lipase
MLESGLHHPNKFLTRDDNDIPEDPNEFNEDSLKKEDNIVKPESSPLHQLDESQEFESEEVKFQFLRILILSPVKFSLSKLGKKPKKLIGITRVIIHFHGGGFICMSSESHQAYLRKYVDSLNALVFSVDYPLAPQTKYPKLIESCAKAYMYILQLLLKVFLLRKFKIILTGDSAGGTICLSLVNWLILNRMPVPDGLLLCYPPCDLNDKLATPSLIHGFNDYILSFFKFKLCLECYVDEEADLENDFMIR